MRLVVSFLLVAALLGGCGDDTVPAPRGVTFMVEQTRQDLQGRKFQLQVVNDSRQEITVERAEFASGRLDEPATYDGPSTIAAGTTVNLTMTMPPARCGDGIDARVRLTYAVGDSETVTSVERPKDRYGSVERFMKRDCAERAVGDIDIDDRLAVRGKGDESTLGIGVTFTPPESGPQVRLVSVGGSTLLAPAGPRATEIERTIEPGGEPVRADVTFIPNRCDVHAVAEDRTGGILPLRVESKAFGTSPVYLRFTEPQKAQIFDYLAERCGFGEEQ
ncbi:hypothetical protein [Aeromicrobium sp.]|uniref:hypothetical protein n=1 Tax=Aeromicrobium sp. TaxID=1871063 RepID=UPI003D6B8059